MLRGALPGIVGRWGVTSLLGLPCGDSYSMSTVDLGAVESVGVDTVPELVERNRWSFGGP